ncbi:MAG TPA: erythromycin esterase family protein [Segetibacter sp.]|jgi:erythromycin esterase-like protein
MKALLLNCFLLSITFLFSDCKNRQPQSPTSAQQNNNATISQVANKDTVRLKIPNHPLRNEQDLDVLIREIGDARVVLLGEASHGTSEYYTWRTALSKRLIQEKGFNFIAVEGEWADSYKVNNFIKGAKKDSAAVLKLLENYNRWPTWMWGNYEVASLITWLNNYNQQKSEKSKIGFFGLDVYCLWESMTELTPYLKGKDAAVVNAAKKVHQCFQPYSSDPQDYAMAVANTDVSCRAETNRLYQTVRKITGGNYENEDELVMEQNAAVALNGERYYRAMVSSSSESWNIRDEHMAETLGRLLKFHGTNSKAIIWEHNTHVGDARYTDMRSESMVNVGELARKQYGEKNVFIVGFGSYQGSVIAAESWGAPIKRMEVPAAVSGSWEQILHQLSATNKIILSREIAGNSFLNKSIGHRAIGVVYNPQREHLGNYVPSIIPKRYDAFVFIDKTKALRPLGTKVKQNEPPDLYPSGD